MLLFCEKHWKTKIILASLFCCFANFVLAQTPTPTFTPSKKVDTKPVVPKADLPDESMPIQPNFEAPPRPLPSAERIGVDLSKNLSLTLEDAIEMALKNNNDIEATRTQVEIAEYNLENFKEVFQPKYTVDSFYESATNPVASTIGGANNGALTQKRFFSSANVNGISPYLGASYSATFSQTYLTSNSTNATLNPQFPLNLTLTYTQPLFRGRLYDINKRNLAIAKKNLSLSDSQFRQKAIEVIADVEQAYWDLVFALRNLQVQLDAVKQSKTQLESNQRLVAKGVIAPIDIVAATAQITTFEQNVYTAQETVTRAENTLKTLLLPDRKDEVWSRPITPVSSVSLETPKIGLEVAISEALKNRPELSQFETNAEINDIDLEYYKEQAKPKVDLVGTYTTQGLAGTNTGIRAVPSNLEGGYFNSFGNLITQDYPTYRIGVTISLPFKDRTAEANISKTLAQGELIKNQRDQAEQIIEAQVRNALQSLRSAEARLNSAIATRNSAEQLYDSEARQFKGGITTFYLVLQRQTELFAARGRELQAQTDLNKAISEFQRATGITLTANKISVLDNKNPEKNKFRSRFNPNRDYFPFGR
jgi:HAE1 family hydrophobic/amphiphilic exporter-1